MTFIQSRGFQLFRALSSAAFTISMPLDNTSSVWSPTQLKIFLISNQNFPLDNLQLLPLISALGSSRKRQALCPIQLLQRVLKTEETQFSSSTQRLLVSPSDHLGVPHSSRSVPDFTNHLTTEILLLKEGLTQLRDYPQQYSAAKTLYIAEDSKSVTLLYWTQYFGLYTITELIWK